MSAIRVYALRWAPPFAQGLVRDLRVRWALEEAGLDYEVVEIDSSIQATPEYRTLQPFGQVPAYEEGDLRMFESGAIVMHVAQRSPTLLPADSLGRARATAWLFAALTSVEPPVQQVTEIDLFHATAAWAAGRRPIVLERARNRLNEVARALGSRDWLEDRFTMGDLMMASVLRIPRHTDLVSGNPTLAAYVARCEARPAFQRALAAQMSGFAKNAPPGS